MNKNGQMKVGSIINNKFSRNLLLCTTAMTALMFASSPSMAANECGPTIVNGTVTCNGDGNPITDTGPFANGISYNINGQTLNVNGALLVINSGVNNGVSLIGGTTNNSTMNIGTTTSVNITTTGASAKGINSDNTGTGNLTINSGAHITVSGPNSDGIKASHSGAGNISITSNGGIITASSNSRGIFGLHTGSGAISITSSFDINTSGIGLAGGNSNGILGVITNNVNTKTVSINATGGIISTKGTTAHGIHGQHNGLGAVLINSAATINTTASGANGIQGLAINVLNTKSITIGASGSIATAGTTAMGIQGRHAGLGATVINSTADITTSGQFANAIFVRVDNVSNTAVANANANAGTIATSGQTADGIRVTHAGTGAINIVSAASIAVTGLGSHGISAIRTGAGTINVTISGGVSSIFGDAIRTLGNANDLSTIALNTGANVIAANPAASAISNDEGDSAITVNTGAAVSDAIRLANGDDALTFAGGSFVGVTRLDGGDDIFVGDGFIDTLTFAGSSGTLTGANVVNWERININAGSTIGFTDAALTAGLVTINNGGTFNAGANFGLISDLTLNAGGLFTSAGGGAGVFSLIGTINNGGTITTQDGSAGDRLTFEGAYTGNNGTIKIDTVLGGDGSATDLITANNGTAGTTTLNVKNAGGTGAATVAGIKVITMGGGASNGAFVLAGDHLTPDGKQAIVGGAYSYRLVKQGSGDWHLVSSLTPAPTVTPTTPITPTPTVTPLYQPGSPVYEAYPQTLQALNSGQSYYQRLGSRYSRFDNSEPQIGDGTTSASSTNGDTREGQRGPFWGKVSGQFDHVEPNLSTTSTRYNIRSGKMQVGIDMLGHESTRGNLFFGVTGQYGFANADVSSIFGNGKVKTKGYGFGITSTWITENGFYLDGQAHFNWFDTDLSSDTLGWLVNNNTGYGQSWSLETGMPIETGTGWRITPQAQLTYANIRFNQFVDRSGALVSLGDGNSLIGRAGFSLARDTSWTGDDGSISRGHFYGIANVYNQFENGTETIVSGVNLKDRRDRMSGEIGLGFNLSWAQDKFSLYGDVKTSTSLENTGNSYAYGGTLGFKVRF